jgi:hypothetical protein
MLPEDGAAHHTNKVGGALDVSHVQLMQYMEIAEYALREALAGVRAPTETQRYYARDDPLSTGSCRSGRS